MRCTVSPLPSSAGLLLSLLSLTFRRSGIAFPAWENPCIGIAEIAQPFQRLSGGRPVSLYAQSCPAGLIGNSHFSDYCRAAGRGGSRCPLARDYCSDHSNPSWSSPVHGVFAPGLVFQGSADWVDLLCERCALVFALQIGYIADGSDRDRTPGCSPFKRPVPSRGRPFPFPITVPNNRAEPVGLSMLTVFVSNCSGQPRARPWNVLATLIDATEIAG